jgi:hypothetical protein
MATTVGRGRRRVIIALLSILPVAAASCGGSNGEPLPPDVMNDVRLREVGELYRIYQANKKKAPKALKDLNAFANSTPSAYESIHGGAIVVRWGATLPDTSEEPTTRGATEVLAYLKDVPQQGGPVLMLDRSTRRMTANEFKAAKLAGSE